MHSSMYIIKSNNIPLSGGPTFFFIVYNQANTYNNIPLSGGPTFFFIVYNQANTYKVESAGALEIWSKHY